MGKDREIRFDAAYPMEIEEDQRGFDPREG